MNTWIPLWSNTINSTLWEEAPHVRVMFLTLLMMRDFDHVVREPFRRIMKAANLSEDKSESERLAREALSVLSSPDLRSVDEQEFEGRRIEQVEKGFWKILNGQKYQDEMMSLTARLRKTRLQREARAKKREEEAQNTPERAKKVKGIMKGVGPLADRLREQAQKNGDSETVKRLEEIEQKENPAAAEFRETFQRNVALAQAEAALQKAAGGVLPVKEDPEEVPEVPAPRPEGVRPGETFPEV